MSTRLILLEGPVGAGKTTTAERLVDRLTARGVRARYVFGFDPDHPIATRCEVLARRAFASEPFEPPMLDPEDERVFTAPQWSRLALELATRDEVLVVEGKYFQQCLEYPYLLGAGRDGVLAIQQELIAAMAPAAPRMIYFRCTEPAAHRAAVVGERPAGWPAALGDFFAAHPWGTAAGASGAEAFHRFYDEWAPVEAELVARHPGPKLELVDAHLDRERAWTLIDALTFE